MFKFSKKQHTYTGNVSNISKVNKDTRATPVTSIVNFEHISPFILLLLLLNSVWENIVLDNKFVFSNCEKYIVLWAGKVRWATRFHLYSRLRKGYFSRQPFRNLSRTLGFYMMGSWVLYRFIWILHFEFGINLYLKSPDFTSNIKRI